MDLKAVDRAEKGVLELEQENSKAPESQISFLWNSVNSPQALLASN